MAGAWRTISVALTANTTGYTSGLRMAAGQTKAFGRTAATSAKQAEGAAKTAGGAWQKLGLLAKGGALAGALALFEATRSAVQFEASMRNVNSISGLSEGQLKKLSGEVVNLSRAFPQSANTLAEGLYEIASSGFQGAEGMTVLTASARAASAGLTTTDNAAKAITSVLNAYALEASEAAFVSDALFQTVNVGVVTFEELTGVIGDVVGTAAAAGQGIDEVGQAIATMTLSGISANEAGTSLNRLLQAMIDPSAALGEQLKKLGYESGAAALEQDGLAGVVGKLTSASEGNIETLLRWFPEIRAARGALALMNNEGSIYAKTIKSWDAAHKGVGATQRAFAEQMKSTKAQLTLLFNSFRASGIELGTKFLPYILGAIETLKELGNAVLPFIRDRMDDLGRAAGNLRVIIEGIVESGHDVGIALATIGGAAVMAAITALTSGLAAVTGFLADHPVLIHTITAALVVLAAVKTWDVLITGAKAYGMVLNILVRESAALRIAESLGLITQGFRSMATGAGTSLGQIRGGLAGLGGALGGAVSAFGPAAAAVAVLTVALNNYQNAQQDAQDSANEWKGKFDDWLDPTNMKQVSLAVKTLQEDLSKKPDENWFTGIKRVWNNISFKDMAGPDIEKQREAYAAMREELDRLQQIQGNYTANTRAIRRETGLTDKEIVKLANRVGVDLTKGFQKTEKGRLEIIALAEAHKALARDAQKSGLTVEQALALPDEELTKIVEAQAKMDAFVGSMGLLGPTVIATANTTGAGFEQMTGDAEKFIESVAGAFQEFGNIVGAMGTDAGANYESIEKFYSLAIGGAEQFTKDINFAIKNGYDPQLIARILQEGPEKAGPFLRSMVSNHSEDLKNMVNESEEALREITQAAAEMARLTNMAVTSSSSDMTEKLGVAMAISQEVMRQGGKASAQAVADELGIGVYQVALIAEKFGIVLADGLNPVLAGVGVPKIPRGTRGGVNREAYAVATGGYIDPARFGDTRRDSVPAVLMPGEVVIKRASVEKFGARNLLDINAGRMPTTWGPRRGFAEGGFVFPEDVPKPPDVKGFGDKVGYTGDKAMQHAYKVVVDYVKKNSAIMMGANAPGVRAAPEVLRGWLTQAIKVTGVPANWLNGLIARAMQESGGNPRAINLWDSNAAKGVPSKGLMQTIEPTFNAYKLPGYGDIWNPVHNAVAAIRYIIARYGSVYNLPRGGYAEGGQVPFPTSGALVRVGDARIPFGAYDKGGYLPKGLSLAYNGTGAPEHVGPPVTDVHVNVYVGNEKLDARTDYRIERNNERIAVGLRKGAR
jgi:TP901 family phage tail tape measure protein